MVGVSTQQTFLSQSKVAILLGLSRLELRKHIRTGKLRTVAMPADSKGGVSVRVHVSEVVRFAQANSITINRQAVIPALGCLPHFLLVGSSEGILERLRDGGRQVSQVPNLFSAGIVMARQWFDMVVLDADSISDGEAYNAAKVIRDIGAGCRVGYVASTVDAQDWARAKESVVGWEVRATSQAHKFGKGEI